MSKQCQAVNMLLGEGDVGRQLPYLYSGVLWLCRRRGHRTTTASCSALACGCALAPALLTAKRPHLTPASGSTSRASDAAGALGKTPDPSLPQLHTATYRNQWQEIALTVVVLLVLACLLAVQIHSGPAAEQFVASQPRQP
jgi:hypothetical protein